MCAAARLKRSGKTGLPPGTPIHIGERKADQVQLRAIDYNEDRVEERFVDDLNVGLAVPLPSGVRWVNLTGLHDLDTLKGVGDAFGLHPLVVEDIANTDQRPKVEDYEDYLYIVFKMLTYEPRAGVGSEQVSVVLGRNFVVSFQEWESDVFKPIRERIKSSKGLIRKLGSDFLVYSLLDIVVDHYFAVTEALGDEIETISEKVLANPNPATMATIHRLRRELMFLHRAVWPLREVVGGLGKKDSGLVTEATGYYIRDLYDHTVQVMDAVEIYREMMSDLADIYLSGVSNRLNTVMKVLTIIATIFIPLTFLAGVYGMNFKYLPELGWRYGYFGVLVAMVLIAAGMLAFFKSRDWW
ncbi:MAG TPA: magnesium and cobalt transport protein CorA [Deltaproteobacteria bacterium]|nr:magnesium and cobalt transport protein CorA [Deltaproteobacteria bacterium]